jgi:rSAM/selenodomain-associated transferase 1
MMRDVAIVFARVPRLGTVKRRLARDIGDRAALRFHQETLFTLLRALAGDGRMRVVAALTPDRARTRLPNGVRRINQGPGDLGVRMARAFARFPRRRVALLGSDIPEAGAPDLRAAFHALGSADAAFGPALDGGYWLVALGPRRPARPFARARWSTEYALADTLANFTGKRVATLRALSDVDTLAAYQAWRQSAASPV